MKDDRDESNEIDDGDSADDRELIDQLAMALTEGGELLPTDEAEVERAEQQGVEEIELPAALSEPPTPKSAADPKVADLNEHRRRRQAGRGWLTHSLAVTLGAAAAVLLMLQWAKHSSPRVNPTSEPAGATSSPPPEQSKVELALSCEGTCCAGAKCKTPRPTLEKCPSGRRCIRCDPGRLVDSRYRLRIGALHPAEVGNEALKRFPQGKLQVCVRAGASSEVCVPAHVSERTGGRWTTLPVVASGEDLAAKVTVRLHWKGVKEPQATPAHWTMPVALTATSLCRGYSVRFQNADKEVFGVMSLFMDDAHYVELLRAPEPAPLRAYYKRLKLSGLTVAMQKTSKKAGAQFVLTAGPFDRSTAEKLRWQLLEQKQTASVTVGADFIGEPLALP